MFDDIIVWEKENTYLDLLYFIIKHLFYAVCGLYRCE